MEVTGTIHDDGNHWISGLVGPRAGLEISKRQMSCPSVIRTPHLLASSHNTEYATKSVILKLQAWNRDPVSRDVFHYSFEYLSIQQV